MKKKTVNTVKEINKAWDTVFQKIMDVESQWIYPLIVNMKPETEKEKLARLKKEKAFKISEYKRRAKKITMTVGEFEDKLEEERDYYND